MRPKLSKSHIVQLLCLVVKIGFFPVIKVGNGKTTGEVSKVVTSNNKNFWKLIDGLLPFVAFMRLLRLSVFS